MAEQDEGQLSMEQVLVFQAASRARDVGMFLLNGAFAPIECAGTVGAVFLLLLSVGIVSAADRRETIQKAIDEYSAAMETKDRDARLLKFRRAEQLFRQAIEREGQGGGVVSSGLYVNLGNAALQGERFGPAIAAYRHALCLNPRDVAARQNLAYARTLLPKWIRHDQSHSLIDSFFFWRSWLTRGEILIYGAVGFALASLLLAIGVAWGYPVVRNLGFLSLLVWFLLMLVWGGHTLFLLWNSDWRQNRGVVITQETVLHVANSENSASSLVKPLPSGVEALLIEQRDRWSEIGLPSGLTGWVPNTTIERIED